MAPQVGLEPTTLRLTAGCSAIELLRINAPMRVLFGFPVYCNETRSFRQNTGRTLLRRRPVFVISSRSYYDREAAVWLASACEVILIP